ncbi:Similar to Nmt1: Glycylpeptide N-tetradecanoyltransferase 1 (Rattus norvegicus) [Cotesia congregata]|uniref:Similar to Nmt1: Glycylpeptide N-tetradecanoyltransferase 1 (Rattus norvegicus) n=1 Tax=Cotesia congregata TaxID=51543 RepID=A0A8J2HIG6_COTCN|nr:Similar to Nmt1: Glycylpeptide N-tetradecanoyltransferase 1 (Rattus norvegicus) [Cotesia congregata]
MEDKNRDSDRENKKEDNHDKNAKSKSSKKRDRKKKNQTANSGENNQIISPTMTSSEMTSTNASGEVPGACFSIKEIQMAMEVLKMQHKPAKTQEEALQKTYQFWSTQPVPKMEFYRSAKTPVYRTSTKI